MRMNVTPSHSEARSRRSQGSVTWVGKRMSLLPPLALAVQDLPRDRGLDPDLLRELQVVLGGLHGPASLRGQLLGHHAPPCFSVAFRRPSRLLWSEQSQRSSFHPKEPPGCDD